MLEKLQIVQQRFDEVSDLIVQPDIISDQKRYIQLNKEYKDLSLLVEKIKIYKTSLSNLKEAESMLKVEKDSEMISMAKLEIDSINIELPKLEEEIKLMLIPKDPDDSKNVVIEIRAGTGGDEAGLFVGDLFRMFTRLTERKKWQIELISSRESEKGGFKEVVAKISGKQIYRYLKFESGVHRVQRVPQTETQGQLLAGDGLRVWHSDFHQQPR